MKRMLGGIVLGTSFVFCFAVLAQAATVTDLDTSDRNEITSVVQGSSILTIYEDYNETALTPFPSHDGQAVVNPAGGFFETSVSLDGPLTLEFHITNTTPYTWSDYHFIFGDDFAGSISEVTSSTFLNVSSKGKEVTFWAPLEMQPGASGILGLTVSDDQNFTLTQVATTSAPPVPEPATMLLLGSGLVGLWGARRKFKK